jgi:two-component system, sensor histidine kinase RegB
MKLLEAFKSENNIYLDKKTLVVLRWIAIIGQFITINVVYFILNFNFPFYYCCFIIFFGIVTNLFLQFRVKKNLLSNLNSTLYLTYDLFQLGVLVFFTGGITNPFVILLVIPAVVSSAFLSLKSTISLSFITVISLLLLTLETGYNYPLPSSGELHFHAPKYYLYGIPIAIIIGLIFLSYFGARFGLESRKRTDALNKMELVLAKEHELKIIGVQAAAAAHSLSTPLSTIKLVAKELEKEIGNNEKYSKDINLLLSQSTRCGEILKKLSMVPVKRDEFFENVGLKDLLIEITESFKVISNKNFIVKFKNNENNLIVKRKAELTYSLRNFIGNASKFSSSLVEIKIDSNKEKTQIKICDDGPGFSQDIKNFLGEPYIRSKNKIINSKSGLGLGTFIGKTLLERMKANVFFSKCPDNNGAMVIIEWDTKNLLSI